MTGTKLQQLLYNNTQATHDRNKNYNNYYITILQQHMTGTKLQQILYNNTPATHDRNKNYNHMCCWSIAIY
jgi:hypothetical protein